MTDNSFLEFHEYVVLKQFPVAGGESDIFLVQKGNCQYILKLYHFGEKPKSEVFARLQDLGNKHPDLFVSISEYGFDEKSKRFFEVGEYIPGGDLKQILEKGPLSEDQVFGVSRTIFRALAVLHENGILHLDLKPSNILIRDASTMQTAVSDFGISTLSDPDKSRKYTQTKGTSLYQSPESLAGAFHEKSDWWALGCLIIEMVTGKHPFEGLRPQVIFYHLSTQGIPIPPLPGRFSNIVRGLLIRDPDKRWGKPEVAKWVSGEKLPEIIEEPAVNIEKNFFPGEGITPYSGVAGTTLSPPLFFQAQSFFSLETLIARMVSTPESWDNGCKLLVSNEISNSLKGAGNLKDGVRVGSITGRNEPRELVLLRLQGTFLPEAPIYWRGEVMNQEFFRLLLLKAAGGNSTTEELKFLELFFSGKIHSVIDEAKGCFPEKTEQICSLAATLDSEKFPDLPVSEKAKFLYWTLLDDSYKDPCSLAIMYLKKDGEAGLAFRILMNPRFLPWVRENAVIEEPRASLLEFLAEWMKVGFPANAATLLETLHGDKKSLGSFFAGRSISPSALAGLLKEQTCSTDTWILMSSSFPENQLLQKLLLISFGLSSPSEFKRFSPKILWCLRLRDELPRLNGRLIPPFLEKAIFEEVFFNWKPLLNFLRLNLDSIPQSDFSLFFFPEFPEEISPTRKEMLAYLEKNGIHNPEGIPWYKFGYLIAYIRMEISNATSLNRPIFAIIPFLGGALASIPLGCGTVPAALLYFLDLLCIFKEKREALARIREKAETFSRPGETPHLPLDEEEVSTLVKYRTGDKTVNVPAAASLRNRPLSRHGLLLLIVGFLINLIVTPQIAIIHKSKYLLYLSFLIHPEADPNLKMDTEPLISRFSRISPDAVSFLISIGADPNPYTVYSIKPLDLAIMDGNRKMMELLLENGAILGDLSTFPDLRKDILDNVCAYLISCPYQGQLKNSHGAHFLHFLSTWRSPDQLKSCLGKGWDINTRDRAGQTPLCWAIRYGDTEAATILIAKGANLNSRDIFGNTPGHLCADKGNLDILEKLGEKGTKLDARNNLGATLLHYAAGNDNETVCSYLLSKGIDANIRDNEEWTPLHYAAFTGKLTPAFVLIKNGADVNAATKDGSTPLKLAEQNPSMVKFLQERGGKLSNQ